jgi:hypothetical protein
MNSKMIYWMLVICLKSTVNIHSTLHYSEPSTNLFVILPESVNFEYTEGSINSPRVLANGRSRFTLDFGPPGSSQPKYTYTFIPPKYQIYKLRDMLTHGSLHQCLRFVPGFKTSGVTHTAAAILQLYQTTILSNSDGYVERCPKKWMIQIFFGSQDFCKLVSFAHNTWKPLNTRNPKDFRG